MLNNRATHNCKPIPQTVKGAAIPTSNIIIIHIDTTKKMCEHQRCGNKNDRISNKPNADSMWCNRNT